MALELSRTETSSSKGIDRILESNGIDCFLWNPHLVEQGKSEGVPKRNTFTNSLGMPRSQFPQFQWGSTAQPTFVSSLGIGSKISAFARDAKISGQVWSADIGYREMEDILSQVCRRCSLLACHGQAFSIGSKDLLSEFGSDVVRQHAPLVFVDPNEMANFPKRATITTCFDTELFGHWWHEGPLF